MGWQVTRDSFKQVGQQALDHVTAAAEGRLGRPLPRRFCFSWLGKKELAAEGDIAEFLTGVTYVDESHIWPCFDLFLERLLPDGRLLLMGYRAGFPPCPYGEHVTYRSLGHDAGRVGPFKLGCKHIVEQFVAQRPIT
jgi:hypothetical protein